ncbi:hypothetical protein [Companilactobacillus alimentarius]|nr:hypothetical protein [Companilactobacillus alimentarius]GEO43937.1 hypothetical protein LAL01_01690 [Companilactobacillus alimentarius]
MDDVFQGFNNWLDIKTMPNGKRRVIKAAVTLFSRQGFEHQLHRLLKSRK